MAPSDETSITSPDVSQLLRRISDDVKAIATDELQLAKVELARRLKTAAIDAGGIILGGVVVLLSIAFLCVAAVDALAPVIPQLWLRLLIMGVIYGAGAGALVNGYTKRLKRHIPRELPRARSEAVATIEAVKEELRHA